MDEMNNTMMNEVNETEAIVTNDSSTDSGESAGMAGVAIFAGVCALAGYGAYTLGKKIVGKAAPVVKGALSNLRKPKEEPVEPVDIEVEAKEVETEEAKK